jgi:hypothetical protein
MGGGAKSLPPLGLFGVLLVVLGGARARVRVRARVRARTFAVCRSPSTTHPIAPSPHRTKCTHLSTGQKCTQVHFLDKEREEVTPLAIFILVN